MPEISPEAQALIDRLACMDPARPRSDKATIERAIALHLAELGLPARPCIWSDDALASYRIVSARGEGSESAAGQRKAETRGAAERIVSQASDWGAGIYAREATWDVARCRARWAAEEEVRHTAHLAGFDTDAYGGIAFALEDAIEAVGHVNQHAALGNPATAKAARSWLPLLDAFEAGLLLYWVTSRDVVCVLQPALSIVNGQLHRTDGPAVEWPSGEAVHLRHGLRLPDMTRIRPEAEALLRRLARMNFAAPRSDRVTVERAIAAYLETLALPSRPVVWAEDAQAGYLHVAAASRARGAAWKAARAVNWNAVAGGRGGV